VHAKPLRNIDEVSITLETGGPWGKKEATMSNVFVLDTNKQALNPVHPGRARLLLKQGKAAVYRRFPFTVILKRVVEQPVLYPLRVKIDPGSQTTGFAVVNDASGAVVWAAELTHRGEQIKRSMDTRRAIRRSRRQRKTRYRKPRCAPRHAVMYPPKIGEELEGRFLGHPSYLELKSEGDHSMMGTRGTSRGVADEWYPQDPHRRAKARLLEL
jgi:hypothetical protein